MILKGPLELAIISKLKQRGYKSIRVKPYTNGMGRTFYEIQAMKDGKEEREVLSREEALECLM